jgi:hypothetical protein
MDDSTGLTAIDRALAEALDVDVSPDFTARVRQRIAREPKAEPFRRGWRIAVPAAAAAVVLVAAGVAMLTTRAPSSSQPLAGRPVAVGSLGPVDVRQARPVLTVAPPRSRRPAPVTAAPVAAEMEMDVLVPPEEIAMYRRLIAAAQHVGRAVVVETPPDIVAARVISEIPIDPIRIDLIVPPIGGEGDRQ